MMGNFQTYLGAIEKKLKAGDATEHTHRPALQAYADSITETITATNEPKRIACGAPDFVVPSWILTDYLEFRWYVKGLSAGSCTVPFEAFRDNATGIAQ